MNLFQTLLLASSLGWFATPDLSAAMQSPNDSLAAAGPELEVAWTYSSFGNFIGAAGILTAETPQGLEMYVGGLATQFGPHNDYWHALRWDPVASDFQTVFASNVFESALIEIVMGDLHPNPGKELAAVLENGSVIIYGLQDKNEILRFSTLAGDVTDVAVADLDGDGFQDVLANTPTTMWAYRGTGDLVLNNALLAGESVVAGQMDADPAMEIASSNGMVIDAISGLTECNFPGGFGEQMDLSDFDSDGKQELIHHGTGVPVIAVDVDLCTIKWTLNVYNLAHILMQDVNSFSGDEMILSERDGDIFVYDPRNLSLLTTLTNPGRSIFGIGTGDLEGDGTQDIFWGTSNDSRIHAMPWTGAGAAVSWTGHDMIGPFYGPYSGDLDGDGIDEVISASQYSDEYEAGKIVVFNQALELQTISQPTLPNTHNYGIRNVRLQDVDGDLDLEVLVAGNFGSDGQVEIYDYQPGGLFALIWEIPLPIQHQDILDMAVADVDNDGQQEIILATTASDSGSNGNYIAVYDYATGLEEWRTASVGSFWDELRNLEIADVNGDGTLDIVTSVLGGSVYIYDGQTQASLGSIPGLFASMKLLYTAPGQPPYIVLGEDDGNLEAYRWNGSSFALAVSFPLTQTKIKGFTIVDGGYVFTGANGYLRLHAPLSSPNPLWQSSRFGPLFGRVVTILSGNRVLSAGKNAIVGFELQ